jgi:uncharacterized protein (DUF885 family)
VKRVLLVAALAAAPILVTGQGPERFFGPSSQTLLQLFGDYWRWRLAAEPELATSVGVTDFDDRWRDWSKEGRARIRAEREEMLQRAMYLSPGTLTPALRFRAYLMEYELRSTLEAEPYRSMVEPLSPLTGAHNEVFDVVDQMPARTAADYERIIARLEKLPAFIDQHIALMRDYMATGFTQPAVVVDSVRAQLSNQAATPASESPLLRRFRDFPATVSAADRTRLRAAAERAYTDRFVPSWKRLDTFLASEYRPKARSGIGLGSAPGGRHAYEVLVRTFTTTRRTPEEIHELGLAEVARIETEMAGVAKQAGAPSVAAYETQLRSAVEMRFRSRDEMVQYASEVLRRVEPALPTLFARLPKTRVGVRPIPPDRDATSASSYAAGTPDGSRQGWFNLNTYRPESQVKYPIGALVLHEAVPGHHLQGSLARETADVPDFQKLISVAAFTEGWALYAESLGADLGVYREPASRFGQLASERFRAVRLVVDTGIHALEWSRDRAREYFARHVPDQSLAEVDRYIAWPGQALAYKSGELKIRELRQRAERALGARFDVREFHDVVLRNGEIPLDMLEEQVDAYIAGPR